MFFNVFQPLGLLTSKQNWTKNVPRAIKNQAKKWSTSWPNFWSIFGPTWIDFGRILASKLEPSWDQMRIKSNPKTNQKNDCFLEGFQIDFGWILAPSWDPGGVTWNAFWVSWRVLGLSWGQDGPQDGPKRPQDAPRRHQDRFRSDFCRFLSIFWLIFDRFLVDFRLNFGVLVCWVAGCLVLCLACLLN